MNVPAEKLDETQPVGMALRDVLNRMIVAGAPWAELVLDLGDTRVKLHLTIVAVQPKKEGPPE